MRYAKARDEERKEDATYRLYVADSLFFYGQNKRPSERLSDLLKKLYRKMPKKSGDDIVTDMLKGGIIKIKKES